MEGYELDVVDQLLKPVQFVRFLKAISKVFQLTSISQQPLATFPEKKDARQDPYLYCRSDIKMVKVFLEVIIYVGRMKNNLKVITSPGTVIEEFIRVYRSYFVPKAKIRSFTGEMIGLGDVEKPISKLFKNKAYKMLFRPR